MLFELTLRSMLARAEPLESVRCGTTGAGGWEDDAERAASSLVRCSSCVSMLILACRGGLLMLGLSSPLAAKPAGCDVGKEESRSGDPT